MLAVQGDQLVKWESFSRSRELLSLHCSLAGCGLEEDLGDTKQEALNKWKLWMFILGHSSGSKTRQKSQDPARETRLPRLRVACRHWGAVSVPSWHWSELDGIRQGGPPPPIGWLPSSFLTVLMEPGSGLIPLCQGVTVKQSFFKYQVNCRSSNHNRCSRRIYQDQVAPD